MTDNAKFTHTLWAGARRSDLPETENPPDQNSERLLEAGEGWIDKDNIAHLRVYAMPVEDTFTGYLQLTPRGKLPMKQDVPREGKVRSHLFTFLEHPEAPPDNNGSERELRPTATYRKVTGGFRSHWGADLFAAVRSVVGTAARQGRDAYQAIRAALQ
jgi:hypothetical protein